MHCGEFGIKRNSYVINTGDTPRDKRNVPTNGGTKWNTKDLTTL